MGNKVNTAACRRKEMLYHLSRSYALSHKELMRAMKLGKSSVWRYLSGLVEERIVRVKYTMRVSHSKKPVTYYGLRTPK